MEDMRREMFHGNWFTVVQDVPLGRIRNLLSEPIYSYYVPTLEAELFASGELFFECWWILLQFPCIPWNKFLLSSVFLVLGSNLRLKRSSYRRNSWAEVIKEIIIERDSSWRRFMVARWLVGWLEVDQNIERVSGIADRMSQLTIQKTSDV